MMEKVQRFGVAMFTPVLLFSFSGIIVALAIIFKNPLIVGGIANEGTVCYGIWSVLESGAWTVFNQMELLFMIALPIGLAKKANARVVMEAFVVYLTCNYFISSLLAYFGAFFGVTFEQEVGGSSGMKLIAGIKTLDTGIIEAIRHAHTFYCYATGYSQRKVVEELAKMLMICDKRAIVIPVTTELDSSMSRITKEDLVFFCFIEWRNKRNKRKHFIIKYT